MKTRLYLIFLCLILSSQSWALSLSAIEMNGFEKTVIDATHLRFESKENSKLVVHVQVDESEKIWTEKNLKQDVTENFEARKKVYETFSFSDVTLDHYKLSEIESHQRLKLLGSYKNPSKVKVYFIEDNIYYPHKFMQIKILKEGAKISDGEAETIFKNIPVAKMEI
jgi:hypothetical protein